jgi:hypothetical protein
LLELAGGEETVFIDDDDLLFQGFLEGGVDEQALDGRRRLEDGTRGGMAGQCLAHPIPVKNLHGLGAGAQSRRPLPP